MEHKGRRTGAARAKPLARGAASAVRGFRMASTAWVWSVRATRSNSSSVGIGDAKTPAAPRRKVSALVNFMAKIVFKR